MTLKWSTPVSQNADGNSIQSLLSVPIPNRPSAVVLVAGRAGAKLTELDWRTPRGRVTTR